VNAWGYGLAGYAAARTRAVVKAEDHRSEFITSASRALAILRDAGAVPAYYFLLNRSTGHVSSWGPAFFTKFLYFADPRNQPGGSGGALILDQVMDGQVRRLVGDLAVDASRKLTP
ncbi:MAG TPA: hypothetical protein VHA75_00925, partial [Rugosimonospora sp.]|nr:hypothetical protein [Rugosimonospora sp.]